MHGFIPKSNNPNDLSEMLPNELWRKTFMSWNAVLGCNILIYWEFIFLFLKKNPTKNKSEISNEESALWKQFFKHYWHPVAARITLFPPLLLRVLLVAFYVAKSRAFHSILGMAMLTIRVPASQLLKALEKSLFLRTSPIYKRLPIGNDFPVSRRAWCLTRPLPHIQPER